MSEAKQLDNYLAKKNFDGGRKVWSGNRIKLDYILKRLGKYFTPGMEICDIGIGEGYMLNRYHEMGMKPCGVDIAQYSIDYLKKKFMGLNIPAELICADISKTEFGTNRFDIISVFDILEHLPPDGLAPGIRNIKRALKPGGLVVGSVPFREDLEASRVVCPECGHEFHKVGHFHSFQTKEEIVEMLTPELELIEFGDVPYTWFKVHILNRLGSMTLNTVKKIANRKFDTTVYFAARKVK